MKTTVIASVSAAGLLAGLLVAAPSVGAATAPTHACAPYYFAPQYKHVTHITVRGGTCRTARHVVAAYEHAITQTISSSGGSTGVCFGAKSFGRCTISYAGRHYDCNRPLAPGRAIPATCTRRTFVVHFRG
jgi:hypothetical protein